MKKTNACTGKVSFWRNCGSASVEVVQDDWLYYWLIWKFKFPQFYWANPHQTTKGNRFILEGRCKGESWDARDISGEEVDMTIWWLPTVWQSMTPLPLKNSGYTPGLRRLMQLILPYRAYKESLFHHVCRQGYHQRHPMTTFNFKEKLHVWKDHTMLLRNERNRNS